MAPVHDENRQAKNKMSYPRRFLVKESRHSETLSDKFSIMHTPYSHVRSEYHAQLANVSFFLVFFQSSGACGGKLSLG